MRCITEHKESGVGEQSKSKQIDLPLLLHTAKHDSFFWVRLFCVSLCYVPNYNDSSRGGGKYPQFYSTASSGRWFFLAYDFEFESKWWLSTDFFLRIFCSNSTVVQNREQPEPCVYVCLAWKTPIWHSKVTVKVKWKTFHLQTAGWPKQRRSQFGKAGVTKWTPERTSDEICWRFNFLLVKLN